MEPSIRTPATLRRMREDERRPRGERARNNPRRPGYATLGRPEPALRHARRCLAYIESGLGTEDWDLPFAYEALARAYAVAEEPFESRRFEQLARELGEHIADPESREMLLADLGALNHPPRRDPQ